MVLWIHFVTWGFAFCIVEENVPHLPQVASKLVDELRQIIDCKGTNYRSAIKTEVNLAAFLMYTGGSMCGKTACPLGIGSSTVCFIVFQVSRAIAQQHHSKINFPTEKEDVAKVMRGFEKIRGLPYCVRARNRTHIKRASYKNKQHY